MSTEGLFSPIYSEVLNTLSRVKLWAWKPTVWASPAQCMPAHPLALSPTEYVLAPNLPCKCCDCDCVWDFFLEVHLSLLLFLVSVGLL